MQLIAARRPEQVRDHGPQPLACRVLAVPFMPMLHDVVGRDLKWKRKDLDVSRSCQMAAELLGENHEMVAAGDNGRDS